MGLDQYAYAAAKAGQQEEYYDSGSGSDDANDSLNPREIAYWRKHPNLHGYFEALWAKRNPEAVEITSFNGIELELTWDDIEDLERAIKEKRLPSTTGFFFGESSDEFYYNDDLEFIKNAKFELFVGLKVFYNSSW